MSLSAIGIIGAINECVTFFQWAKSAISCLCSRWSGLQDLSLQDRVLQFETGLQSLQDRVLRLEGGSHEHAVANLLPDLKDAVAGTKDLLDEFRCYESKMQVEGSASQSPFVDFHTFIQGSVNKLNSVQLRLNNLSSQLENMELHGGQVPRNLKRKRGTSSGNASTSTSTSSQVRHESRVASLTLGKAAVEKLLWKSWKLKSWGTPSFEIYTRKKLQILKSCFEHLPLWLAFGFSKQKLVKKAEPNTALLLCQ